jgi:hypothetical protein
MKYLFSLLLTFFLINSSYCQFKPQEEIQRIDLKLEKFRSQHQLGTFLSFIGIALATTPILTGLDFNEAIGFMAIGTAVSISGLVVSIDSYKHLKLEPTKGLRETPRQQKNKKPKNWWTPR